MTKNNDMNWFEDQITQSLINDGLPDAFARRMAPGIKDKTIKNLTSKHRDLPAFIISDGIISIVNTSLELSRFKTD